MVIVKRPRLLTKTFGKDRMMRKKIGLIIALLASLGLGFLFCHMWWSRTPVPKQVTVVEKPAPAVVQTPQKEAVITACVDTSYTVVPKDNLWKIAKKVYGGRAYLYPLIAEVNGIEFPYVIQPDQVLKIPMNLCNLSGLPKAPAKTKVVSKKASSTKAEVPPTPAPKPVETAVVVPVPAPPVVAPVQASPAPVVVPAPTPSPVVPAPAVASNEGVLIVDPPAKPNFVTVQAPARVAEVSTPLLTPGSIWNSLVTNPIERGNWVNYFHVDQGIILGRPMGVAIEPYVALNVTQDSKGFQWNNKAKAEEGLKLSKPLANGFINVSGAYATERREETGSRPSETKSGLILYTDGWLGRDQPTNSSGNNFFSNTPGSVWWVVGNVSPFEKGNIIGLARAEQGITAVKVKGVSLIPIGWAQAGFDTQNKPWNRRYTMGGGLEVDIPWNTGVVGFQGGYECTRNYGEKITPSSATCGPAVRLDFWSAWRKIGGK